MTASQPADPLVLHVRVVRGAGGGPDKTILNSPRFLESEGYRCVCAFMRHPDDAGFSRLEERADRWRATVVTIDDRGPLDRGVSRRLKAVCERLQPAIWHGHDYKSNLLGLGIRTPSLRRVTTVHGWVQRSWKTPLYYWLDRRSLRRYERVLCVSRDLRDRCLSLGVAPDRCVLLPNAIDTEEFRRRRPAATARAELGVPEGRHLIGMVGRLSREKRCDLAIEAVADLVERGHDLELWIAGEGAERAALERLAAGLGVGDRVRCVGFLDDPLPFLEALDVFVMSSVREGLPNSLLEAMAVGLPVVATPVAGIPGVVDDGRNGLLVEEAAAPALRRKIVELLESPELAASIGRAARETVTSSFDFGERMRRVARIYDALLGSSAGEVRA